MSKIAVLFGLNYPGTECELRGCANDVENMANFLVGKYNRIYKYTDTNKHTRKYTTRAGILHIIKLLAGSPFVTEVFIHYSGHGSYVHDTDGDEKDSRDEALVPSDYQTAGLILDDEIKACLSCFKKNCRIVMVMDCCHSGTIADLCYQSVDYDKPIVYNGKKPIACKCIMISGCMDEQTSVDAYNMKNQGRFSGALTTCLLDVLPKHKNARDVQREVAKLLKERNFTQVPQVCASFDFQNERFI